MRLIGPVVLLALVAVLGCAPAQDSAQASPSPTAVGDPHAVGDFVEQMTRRGITVTEIASYAMMPGAMVEGCMRGYYRSYELAAGGRMHVFPYDEDAARLAAAEVPPGAECDFPFDWPFDMRYFLYGEVIVFLASEDAEVRTVLEDLAGPAFACARRSSGPTSCPASPG